MYVFPAQFDSHSTGGHNDHKIRVTVDQANSELLKEVGLFPKGKPILVMIYEIEQGQEVLSLSEKDENDMRKKMLGRIHARIGEIESITGVSLDTVKKILKVRMTAHYLLKKDSFADYTEQELANALYLLDTELNVNKFDYSPYK